jgi:ankyrin repeat protein
MSAHDQFLTALKSGDVPGLTALLAADPTLLSLDSEPSPVLLAIYHGQPAAAQVLIEHGAVLDLYEASAAGQLARVAELIAADPTALDAYAPDGFTALGLAAFFGHPALVEWLLAKGADPNVASNNAMRVRPLHSAAANGDPELAAGMAAALLAAGAEPDAVQEGGFTPLHEAALNGKLELARLLLNHGADPARLTRDGQTPRDLAAKNGHQAVLDLLKG